LNENLSLKITNMYEGD